MTPPRWRRRGFERHGWARCETGRIGRRCRRHRMSERLVGLSLRAAGTTGGSVREMYISALVRALLYISPRLIMSTEQVGRKPLSFESAPLRAVRYPGGTVQPGSAHFAAPLPSGRGSTAPSGVVRGACPDTAGHRRWGCRRPVAGPPLCRWPGRTERLRSSGALDRACWTSAPLDRLTRLPAHPAHRALPRWWCLPVRSSHPAEATPHRPDARHAPGPLAQSSPSDPLTVTSARAACTTAAGPPHRANATSPCQAGGVFGRRATLRVSAGRWGIREHFSPYPIRVSLAA
jgi:hypothetical protein